MAQEFSEITLSDRELLEVIFRQQQHILTDLHEFAQLRQQLAPLISTFTSPAAMYGATRRARKAASNGDRGL